MGMKLTNVSGSELTIDDIGVTFAVDQTRFHNTLDWDNLSNSENMVSAVINGDIEVFEEDNSPVPPLNYVRIITGGTGSKLNGDGILRVHASPRPLKKWTYFTGSGDKLLDAQADTWDIGGGESLIFNVKSTIEKVWKDLVFSEDVHIKDGFIIADGAPFGATIEFVVMMPNPAAPTDPAQYIPLNRFGNRIPLLSNGWFPLDADDSGYIPKGMILRVCCHNSSTLDDETDSPATFRVTGRIELYRSQTVSGGVPSDI